MAAGANYRLELVVVLQGVAENYLEAAAEFLPEALFLAVEVHIDNFLPGRGAFG